MAWCFDDNGKTKVDLDGIFNTLQQTYQSNINTLYDKLVALGSTPADKTPSSISNATQAICDAIYNKLVALGQTPASKKVADLNTKIQALTEVRWTSGILIDFDLHGSDIQATGISISFYDASNLVSLKCTALSKSNLNLGLTLTWYKADKTTRVGSEINIALNGTYSPPSGAKYFMLFAGCQHEGSEPYASHTAYGSATLTATYQTKVLR